MEASDVYSTATVVKGGHQLASIVRAPQSPLICLNRGFRIVDTKKHQTWLRVFHELFLPEGYPDAVSPVLLGSGSGSGSGSCGIEWGDYASSTSCIISSSSL